MTTVLAHILRSKHLLLRCARAQELVLCTMWIPRGTWSGSEGGGGFAHNHPSSPLGFTFLFLLQMTLFAESELEMYLWEVCYFTKMNWPVASLLSSAPNHLTDPSSSQSRPPVLRGTVSSKLCLHTSHAGHSFLASLKTYLC